MNAKILSFALIASVVLLLGAVAALAAITQKVSNSSALVSRAVDKIGAAVPDIEAVGYTINKAHAIYYHAPFSLNAVRESAEDLNNDGVQDKWIADIRAGTPYRTTYTLEQEGDERTNASIYFGPYLDRRMLYVFVDKGKTEDPCQIVSLMSRKLKGHTFSYADYNDDGRFDRLTEDVDDGDTIVGTWVMFREGWVPVIDPYHFSLNDLDITTWEGETIKVSFDRDSGTWKH